MPVTLTVEDLLDARGGIYLASLDQLKDIIQHHGIEGDVSSLDRAEAVRVVNEWLTKELSGPDKGVTSVLSLQHIFKEAKEAKDVKPSVKMEPKEAVCVAKPALNMDNKLKITKEFKISGQIDYKSGISYTSLVRQVDTGVKRGYPDVELIDGIIKAIPHTSGLRSYLDGRPELTLATLRKILRAHYMERSATELYNDLSSSSQEAKEGEPEFLMRMMNLRNRILFASGEDSEELKYSPSLVNGLFIQTVTTGILDSHISHQFQPFLKKENISDEELMFELNSIVSRENERKNNSNKVVKRAAVNLLSETEPWLAEMTALKAEIKELKEIVHNSANERNRSNRHSCVNCSKSGRSKCEHCWKCGKSGHLMRNCQPASGNVNRSH